MNKELLTHPTNGVAKNSRSTKKKSKLVKLKEMQEQVETLIAVETGKKKRKANARKSEARREVSFVDKVLTTVNNALLKKLEQDKQRSQQKAKQLTKKKRELETAVALQNDEIRQLRHTVANQQKSIKRTFSSSGILQLVEPTLLKDRNPIRFLRNFLEYRKKKKAYDVHVKTINAVKLNADPTKQYKVNFLEVHKKAIQVGEKWLRLYYLADVPAECSELIYFKLLASPIPFHLSVFVQPSSNASVVKQARRRISALEALQTQRERKGLVRDPELDKSIEQTTLLAEDITYERERAMQYAFYCALEAETEAELDQLEKAFLNETESMELVFNTYTFGQGKAFKSLFPFAIDTVKEDKVMQSSGAAILMPFVTKPLYDPQGIFLGTNVYHNSVVFLNPFTPRNNNINIFGVSGAGKSVTSKILASRMFMMGTQIIIVDPEGEYVKLAKKLGGEVIQFSRKNGINPFYVYGKTEDEILSHISTLKTFFKFFIPPEVYNSAELDEVLITLYKKREQQNFTELLKLLKKSPMREYLKVLYEGSLQGIFTSERKLHLDSEFLVFDLSELKRDEKRAPAMYLLTSLLWSLVNNTTDRRRMLFIDEAHMLLMDKEVAEFYRLLVKVARKRDLGVVSITQDVEDFLDNEMGKAIISNSETKILLKQSYATLGLMDKIYPITDEEKKSLGNMRKGEVVIFREEEHIGAYIQVLPSERALVLTQEAENSHDDQ